MSEEAAEKPKQITRGEFAILVTIIGMTLTLGSYVFGIEAKANSNAAAIAAMKDEINTIRAERNRYEDRLDKRLEGIEADIKTLLKRSNSGYPR